MRWRAKLGLEDIPTSLGVAALLFSTPVLFALERSNYDLLVVPLVATAAFLLRKDDATRDVLIGMFLAIAVWAKIYPGLLLLGLLALKRWRASAWLATFCVFIALSDVPELIKFMANIQREMQVAKDLARFVHDIHPWNHPLGIVWPDLWARTPLALIPGAIGAALVIGTLSAWVSWNIYQSPAREHLAFPYLFWIVAAATFVPAVSNDYNLAPLPLAILALWTWRYGWPIHVGLLLLFLWWQPVALPIPGRMIMLIKLGGLTTVAAMLVQQAKRKSYLAADIPAPVDIRQP